MKSGEAPWPLDEFELDEVIGDFLEADGSSELVQSGSLKIRLNFRDGIQLLDGSFVEWTAARKRPYVRAALRWLQVLRGVRGAEAHELTIDVVGLPVNFCNAFAEVVYEDLRKINGNWIPNAGIICINSVFYERGTLQIDEWREELFHSVLHEMGHVLGVGSLWNLAVWEGKIEPFDTLDFEDSDYDDEPDEVLRQWVVWSDQQSGLIYRGPRGVAAYQRLHGSDLKFVPISDDGGHLYSILDDDEPRENADGLELPPSQPALMADSQVLSEISIGILEDLGWEVDYQGADPWPDQEDWDNWSADEDEVEAALADYFPVEIDVFGVKLMASAGTHPHKIDHAAALLAEYLDNDEDGQPDNQRVIEAMRRNRATLLMAPTEEEFGRLARLLERNVPDLDDIVLQDLYASETHPNGAANGVFDAAYEEVLHLITHAGYSHAYPDAFGEHPGSLLAEAMDVARGGHFQSVPRRYPSQAWYTYYDGTCDYSCQATEYLYWGLTSLLGAQDLPGRLDDIKQEWRLNTPAKLKNGDELLYQLLTDPQFKLPTTLPDGKYQPK